MINFPFEIVNLESANFTFVKNSKVELMIFYLTNIDGFNELKTIDIWKDWNKVFDPFDNYNLPIITKCIKISEFSIEGGGLFGSSITWEKKDNEKLKNVKILDHQLIAKIVINIIFNL